MKKCIGESKTMVKTIKKRKKNSLRHWLGRVEEKGRKRGIQLLDNINGDTYYLKIKVLSVLLL